jgi:hypothetical protein
MQRETLNTSTGKSLNKGVSNDHRNDHQGSAMSDLNNNRECQERRQGESSLPVGSLNRRHNLERRLPEVEMLRLSDVYWQKYFGDSDKQSEKSENKIDQEIDVFNKTRHD